MSERGADNESVGPFSMWVRPRAKLSSVISIANAMHSVRRIVASLSVHVMAEPFDTSIVHYGHRVQ